MTEDKLQSAVENVLKILTDERLTIRESHIVLGRATRHLLEMDIKVHSFESKAMEGA